MQTLRQPKHSTKVRELKANNHEVMSYARLPKWAYSHYYPLTPDTARHPEHLSEMPVVTLGVSLMATPVFVIDGYPIAVLKGGLDDNALDIKGAVSTATILHPILDGAPEVMEDLVPVLHIAARAMGVTVGDAVQFNCEFSDCMDSTIREKVASTKTRMRAVSADAVATAIIRQISKPEYRRNLLQPLRERVATVEYMNRMLVFCMQQNAAKVRGFGDLVDILDGWMEKYKLHLTPDEMMAATSAWQNGKPNEAKMPVISRFDVFPVPYFAREALFSTLSVLYNFNLYFPKELQVVDIPKRAFKGVKHHGKYTESAPHTVIPYRPRNKGTIALPDGTKLVTVHNSQWYDDLIHEVMKAVKNYFDNQIA